MLKAAIIGCGAISQVHRQVLQSLPEAELIACCDIRPNRALHFAEGCRPYTDAEEMLTAEKPDVVHLCVPHPLHTPLARLCVSRGIHVFTEKPPAVDEEQWADFQALAQGPARVGICFQNRFNSSLCEARKLLRSGQTGPILGARAFVTWHREPEYYTLSDWKGSWRGEGGGVLINQSIHTLDLLTWLLGKPIDVECHMSNHSLRQYIEVEDTLESFIRFESGATAVFYATNAYCANAPVLLELTCREAVLRLEGDSLTVTWTDGREEHFSEPTASPLGRDYWGSSHYVCIQDFYRSILEARPFQNDIASVCDTMTLLLRMYAGVRGKKVTG